MLCKKRGNNKDAQRPDCKRFEAKRLVKRNIWTDEPVSPNRDNNPAGGRYFNADRLEARSAAEGDDGEFFVPSRVCV